MEVDPEILKAVRRMVDDSEAEVLTINRQILGEGFADAMAGGDGLLLYTGIAKTACGDRDYEMVEKVCRVLPMGRDPDSWLYWKREALAYESGVLHAKCSGLRAPNCFGVAYTDEPSARVFIEAVGDPQPQWDSDTFAQASEALGVFSGSHLGMPDINRHSWMAIGRAHSWTEAAKEDLNSLAEQKNDPVISRWLSGSNFKRTVELWQNVDQMREALGDLPKCFCHHDAFKRNILFSQADGSGQDIVAIDWAFSGHGVLGEELAAMVGASLTFLEIDPAQAKATIENIFSNYLKGLRKIGWSGSSIDVRLGFCLTTAMTFGLGALGPWLPLLRDPKLNPIVEGVSGMTVDRFVANLAEVHHQFLDLGEEAIAKIGH